MFLSLLCTVNLKRTLKSAPEKKELQIKKHNRLSITTKAVLLASSKRY